MSTVLTVDSFWTFMGGLASFVIAYPTAVHWLTKRWHRRALSELTEATTASVQAVVARNLKAITDRLDPESFFTLDLRFPNGETLHVPVVIGKPLGYLENITLMVTSHNKAGTFLIMECKGFGRITEHSHSTTEEVTVLSGTMTCLATGRVYKTGDKWVIPPHTLHGANCQDLLASVYHHPPLPTAAERPVSLEAMSKIFSA